MFKPVSHPVRKTLLSSFYFFKCHQNFSFAIGNISYSYYCQSIFATFLHIRVYSCCSIITAALQPFNLCYAYFDICNFFRSNLIINKTMVRAVDKFLLNTDVRRSTRYLLKHYLKSLSKKAK